MGPAAWAAVGRALGVALASSFFTSRNNIVVIVAKEIKRSIITNNFEMAEAMLNDMANRHREKFESFIHQFRDSLPQEFLDKYSDYL